MSGERRELSGAVNDAVDALFTFDALAGTHLGMLAVPVVLPMWCRESLVRDASRTGRTAVSIARWALVWPLATVVLLVLPTLALAVVGWIGPIVPIWIVAFLVAGAAVAARARGLGGFLLGMAGLVVGGALVGLGAWLVTVLGGPSGDSAMPTGPIATLVYVPLFAFLVPILAGMPFGTGVVVGSAIGAVRR